MNLWQKLILLVFLSLSSLVGCTNNANDKSNSISFDSETEARKSFTSGTVECGENNLNCPEYVAGLSILINNPALERPWYTQVCSGTLIDHNKFLTNDHCLGTHKIKENDSCAGTVKILFPKTNTKKAETVECAKIHKVSSQISNDDQRPDWVILELAQSVSRKHANLNFASLPEGKKVNSFPVYYEKINDSFHGKLQSNSCTTTMRHYYSAYYFHPESALVTASDCSRNVIEGNSGAGYFNSTNELTFLGSFSVSIEPNKKYQSFYSYGKIHQVTNKFVGGTHLSCISSLNPTPSPFCYFSSASNFKKLLKDSRFAYDSIFDTKKSQEALGLITEKYTHMRWQPIDTDSLFYLNQLNVLKSSYNKKQNSKLFTTKLISNEVLEYLALKITQALYPSVPVCISPNSFSNNESELPVVTSNSFDRSIHPTSGNVNYNSKLESLKFDFIKTNQNIYTAKLLRMTKFQQSEFLSHKLVLLKLLKQCRPINPKDESLKVNGNPCDEYLAKKESLNKWVTENNIPNYLVRNELTALALGDKDFELDIPICKD